MPNKELTQIISESFSPTKENSKPSKPYNILKKAFQDISLSFLIIALSANFAFSSGKSTTVKKYIESTPLYEYYEQLKSLGKLDDSEKEFLDLLKQVPEHKQEYFVKKVEDEGFANNLLEELQSICPKISFGEEYNFRKTEWGMTKDEIIEAEKPKKHSKIRVIKKIDYDMLLYKGYIAGFNSNILYTIREGKLTNTQCTILGIKEGREYFEKYDVLKEFLTENYGKPIQEIYRIDDKYKDDIEKIISALKKNPFAYYTIWETPETKIILRLHRLPTGVILSNQYISKDFLQKNK